MCFVQDAEEEAMPVNAESKKAAENRDVVIQMPNPEPQQ